MASYRNNHYVPQWFQHRFLSEDQKEKKFFYLDLNPEVKVAPNGKKYTRKSVLKWGAQRCFCEEDLYTTKFPNFESTEIEEKFFGIVDSKGKEAVEYFSDFEHPSVGQDQLNSFLRYASVQKIRTPKGLGNLRSLTKPDSKNQLLYDMQEIHQMHCALWSECVWSIVDASKSATKFLLSDNPITVYNQGCYPGSKYCRGFNEPAIWLDGTHTIFPLDLDKALILSNLSWVRNPYGNPVKQRPHADLFRGALFKFTDIQAGRLLSEEEVLQFNYVIKNRALRYVAAQKEEWLYPERNLTLRNWSKIGKSYLFMPDPRSLSFSSDVIIGYRNGSSDIFDEYGRRPFHEDFKEEQRHQDEWNSFHAFKGEYARVFGPKRRGLSYQFGSKSRPEYDPDCHAYHLSLESLYKPKIKSWRRCRN